MAPFSCPGYILGYHRISYWCLSTLQGFLLSNLILRKTRFLLNHLPRQNPMKNCWIELFQWSK